MGDDVRGAVPVSPPPPRDDQAKVSPPSRIREAGRRRQEAAKKRYAGSSAEHLWTRLNEMDFINRGMLFAAILLLCFFPFLIILSALAGKSAVAGLARHLGLNQQASTDLSHLFTSTTATSNAVTGTSYVFFVLGGIAVAASIQELYEHAFELEGRGMKNLLPQLLWLGAVIAGSLFAGWAGPTIGNAGGPVLLGTLGFALLTAFWLFSLWLLLARRVPWRGLLPSAIATAACWIGMEVVFSFIFSNTIISDNKKYGPIGVVFALMSWLIAIGVVIILGAIIGIVWRERQLSFSAAFRSLRRGRSRS
jgi:membrane protein